MSLFVERTAETEFGQIEISITRGSHMSVRGEPLVRDTLFNCHLHFWRQADNSWAVRDEDRPNMSRKWENGMSLADAKKPAPPTYFKKVLEEYTRVVNAFAIANPQLFVEAESADIERDIAHAQSKVEKARTELQEAEKALDYLYLKRNKHTNTEKAA